MTKWIENINNFITNNRKGIITILFFILIFSFDNSFAADAATKTAEESKNSWYIPLVLMSALAGFTGSIIGFFINPEWTNGSIFGLTDQLKNLWVLTSNIVYFIFAFMLILMAFMNIIGHGKNEYEMKTALPKFIVGILIVPFSWFIVQFVVSISSILTVSVLSLPYDLYKSSIDNMAMTIPTNCTLNIQSASSSGTLDKLSSDNEAKRKEGVDSIWNCEKNEKKIAQMFQGDSIFSIMSVYAYGILKINDMDSLKGTQLSSLKTLTDVFLKLGFDIIFLIAFLLLSLAIAMALFVRGVYLWLFMILSPTFGLFYFLGDKKGGDFAKKYSFSQFLSLALVPVYVSAALSFGLLFVLIAQNGILSSSTTGNSHFTSNGDGIKLSENDTFTITGLPGSQKTEGENGKNMLGSIGSLFLIFVSIAILWMAVMAALNSSDITKEIVKPIADFGGNVGKLITEAPKYAPILPGGMSMEGMNTASSTFSSQLRNVGTNKGSEIGNKFAEQLGVGDKFSALLEKIKDDSIAGKNAQVGLVNTIKSGFVDNNKDLKTLSTSNADNVRDNFVRVLDKEGIIKKDDLDKLRKASGGTAIADMLAELSKSRGSSPVMQAITGRGAKVVTSQHFLDKDWLKGNGSGGTAAETYNLPKIERPTDLSGKLANNINININGKETNFQLNDNKLATPDIKTISDAFAKDTSLIGNNKNDFKKHLVNDGKMDETDVDKIIAELEKGNGFFK